MHWITSNEFPYGSYNIYIDYDLNDLLEYVGVPKQYREEVTGACVVLEDADYSAVWLTESIMPFDDEAKYYPLPYYKDVKWNDKNKPVYWSESNPYYNEEVK